MNIEKKQVDIGGHIVSVEIAPIEHFGDYEPEKIRIQEGLTLRRAGEALLHEAGHSFAPTLNETDTGHALWDSLSAQVWQFLWDNDLIHKGNLERLLK